MGREGPGCFTSSPIVFQTMGKVPLSQTRDSPRHRPKLEQRGEGRLWGKKLSAKPVGQRLRRVGEEGRKTKMSWVQPVPTTPRWTPALTLTARAHVLVHLSTSACLRPSTMHSGRGYEAMAAHRLLTCCLWRRQTLSQAALQVPGPIRPWRRKVCTKCEITLPGNGGASWDGHGNRPARPRAQRPTSRPGHPPCSSRTCVCTGPFSSSQPPTAASGLRERRGSPGG